METFTIYKITCLQNNKLYIGYTKHTIDHRLKTHFRCSKKSSSINNKFANAILKYGINNFIIETIEECNDRSFALEREIYYINFYGTVKNGYNSTKGGETGGTSNHNHANFKGENNPYYDKNIVMK